MKIPQRIAALKAGPKKNTCALKAGAWRSTKKARARTANSLARRGNPRISKNASRNRTLPPLRISPRVTTQRETIRLASAVTAARAETAVIAEVIVADGDGADAGEDGGAAEATATGARMDTAGAEICLPQSTLRRRANAIRADMTIAVAVPAARVRRLLRAGKTTSFCRANHSRSPAGVRRSHPPSRLPIGNRKSGSRILSRPPRAPRSACSPARGCRDVFPATCPIGSWPTTKPKRNRLRRREQRRRKSVYRKRPRQPLLMPKKSAKKEYKVTCSATAPPV